MKNYKRRILTSITAALAISAICIIPASAKQARTTEDSDIIGYNVSATSYTPLKGYRIKHNDTSVYLWHKTGVKPSIRVRVLGGIDSVKTNCTRTAANKITEYVYCNMGTQYLIYNDVNERGFDRVNLAFMSRNNIQSERISGAWSPDSVGSYPVANP